jgi:ribosome-associated translation inhibitor RaiA
MSIDISLNITVQVPQLDALGQTLLTIGEKIVETIESIIAEMQRLNTNQADAAAALTAQVTRIADEAEEYATQGTVVTPEQMTNLAAAIRSAADNAAKQAADIRANTESIGAIVPDTPPA